MCTFYSKKCGIGCVLSTKEFKGALRDYLPEKFRWNKHIGIYFYAWAWNMVLDQEDW